MATPQRTMAEYTWFCQALAAQDPDAVKIRVVHDHRNFYHSRAFPAHSPADEAVALAQRFAFIDAPKGASWLTMIAREFAPIARQCLNRRASTDDDVRTQILALLDERQAQQTVIDWQFSLTRAHALLSRRYRNVYAANEKCQETQFTDLIISPQLSGRATWRRGFVGFVELRSLAAIVDMIYW